MSKQAWILVGAILGTSVLVHGVAITWAVGADVDLVREDYYEHGQAFDAELAARERGAAAEMTAQVLGRSLVVRSARPELVTGPLTAELYRASDRKADRKIALVGVQGKARNNDLWHGVIELAPGRWRLRVKSAGEAPLVWMTELDVPR